ncbi:MAG: helix-turn-helix domain-containing protein [Phycisphaeraceae bacterium]|nr:helix-turn-helix domain-containing protein [Phycisphaeraceae bacterium]
MKPLLTPRELAAAIGASESSVRRWVDDGRIPVSRTAGGHRRIPLQDALRFIRETRTAVVRPEVLGFPEVTKARSSEQALADALYDMLYRGDNEAARALILAEYLDGRPLASIFDGPVRSALTRLGALWEQDKHGILIEHRAADICLQILHQIRGLLPSSALAVTCALGGTVPGDPHVIPSVMAAMVLSEIGYRAENYGAELPLQLLPEAVRRQNAAIAWLGYCYVPAEGRRTNLWRDVIALAHQLDPARTQLVLGGQGWIDPPADRPANLHLIENMSELAAFARGLLAKSHPQQP